MSRLFPVLRLTSLRRATCCQATRTTTCLASSLLLLTLTATPGPVVLAQPAPPGSPAARGKDPDSIALLRSAGHLVTQMKADAQLTAVLRQAKGVLFVPADRSSTDAGREGVMMMNTDGHWSNPVFCRMKSLRSGDQDVAATDAVVMLLMSAAPVQRFLQEAPVSLGAEPGLTVTYHRRDRAATAATTRADIVIWTSPQPLRDAAVSATGIVDDAIRNAAFYRPGARPLDIIHGRVRSQHGNTLADAMPD